MPLMPASDNESIENELRAEQRVELTYSPLSAAERTIAAGWGATRLQPTSLDAASRAQQAMLEMRHEAGETFAHSTTTGRLPPPPS